MLALIGLFAGAIVGNLLWHEWGAALGGVAGFIAGATLASWRARRAGSPPGRVAVPAPVGGAAVRGGAAPDDDITLNAAAPPSGAPLNPGRTTWLCAVDAEGGSSDTSSGAE